MSATSPTPVASGNSDRVFLGHPRGLGYLAFTEAWERFSYYGMQTLLVLYMVKQLLLPGHVERIAGFGAFRAALEGVYGPLSTVALASAIFGLYTGLVYLTPIAGGLIADRWLGRTRTITLGALLMAAGHFLMAFDVSFLAALLCLLCGVGCFKGNLASQIGALYAPGDLRRADAFQIYYLFINAAVIVAPLIAGTLGEVYGWHYGFGAAGVGMVIGLVIYLSGRKWLPDESAARSDAPAAPRAPLTRDERKALVVLVLLLPVLAIGAVGNQQIFNAYMLWVPAHVSLVFFGHTMPTTWLVTLDSIVSVSFLLGAVAFWRLWAKRFKEPSEVVKITLGLALSAIGALSLAGAAVVSAHGEKASVGWVFGFELFNSAGFANVFPVGLALFARVAPKAIAGTMMGIYLLHLFLCNNFVGWLGGLLDRLSGVQFWLLHAGLIGAAALLMFTAARAAGHLLNPSGVE
ncbi:MAG TPA: peptide MFS transporter [Opitutaceae bacterium]|nr:peptide MFS transporter [Opitutaceae bacterium]